MYSQYITTGNHSSMLGQIFTVFGFMVWAFNFWRHFYNVEQSDVMIAFVGPGHVRSFEHQWQNSGHDLWAFGHVKRKMSTVQFEHRKSAWDIFQEHSHYKHILLVYDIQHVPLMFDANVPVFYNKKSVRQRTVATLWPKTFSLPNKYTNLTSYAREHQIPIETIFID
mgnify:CR=1 FL=1